MPEKIEVKVKQEEGAKAKAQLGGGLSSSSSTAAGNQFKQEKVKANSKFFFCEVEARYLRCIISAVRDMSKGAGNGTENQDCMTVHMHADGWRGEAVFDAKSVECNWELNHDCFAQFEFPFRMDRMTLQFKIKNLEKQISLAKDDDLIEITYERGTSSLCISYLLGTKQTKSCVEYLGRMKLNKTPKEEAKADTNSVRGVNGIPQGYTDKIVMASSTFSRLVSTTRGINTISSQQVRLTANSRAFDVWARTDEKDEFFFHGPNHIPAENDYVNTNECKHPYRGSYKLGEL